MPPVVSSRSDVSTVSVRADGVVDDGRAVLQPVAPAPRGERRGADAARDLRDEFVGRGGQHGVRAEPGGELGPGAGPRRRPHLDGPGTGAAAARSPRTRACPSRTPGPARAPAGGASRMERSETLTGSASTAASSVTPSGMANSWEGCAAKRSACAPAAAAQFPRWIEAGRSPERKLRHHGYRPSRHASQGGSMPRGNAGQPRVEHDPLAGVEPPPDGLVAEHVREGHQRGERVVARAVQQDLLHVGTAQAGEGGLDAHPVRRRAAAAPRRPRRGRARGGRRTHAGPPGRRWSRPPRARGCAGIRAPSRSTSLTGPPLLTLLHRGSSTYQAAQPGPPGVAA